MKRRRERQHELPLKFHGGRRKGAGRKPKGDRAGVPHRTRAAVNPRCPVHVTVRMVRGLPSLRRGGAHRVLCDAFRAGCRRFGFRLVHYSIQSNHLHLLVETNGRTSLTRGMQGLMVRISRRLNGLWGRRGRVIDDRYQAHVLKTLREVKNALCYVLHNAKKHRVRLAADIDPFSSGRWFDGWRERVPLAESPLARARSWLLDKGWRRCGLISTRDRPAPT